jgi:inactivated superfamily I helicase
MSYWFDDISLEIIEKYGEKAGNKLSDLLSELIDQGEVHSVNQLIGNLLDRNYKSEYEIK